MKTHFKPQILILAVLTFVLPTTLLGQRAITPMGMDDRSDDHFSTDSIEKEDIPIGMYAWRIDERFGTITPTEPDTLPHGFPNDALTSGRRGEYLFTGNLGAPRIARDFFLRKDFTTTSEFIFSEPYDYFLNSTHHPTFTNTKSPITNLTYHECGDKTDGEDYLRASFATNVNKRFGIGFNVNYIYGRGYYANQSTSQIGGNIYGSYIGERYVLHTYFAPAYIKNSENGGLEDDVYITNPEQFSTNYSSEDMPTNLSKTWNKIHSGTFYLTHRLKLGYHRFRNAEGKIVKVQSAMPSKMSSALITTDSTLLAAQSKQTDSLKTTADSLTIKKNKNEGNEEEQQLQQEFVNVAGIVHTLRIEKSSRLFLSNRPMNAGNSTYFNDFFLPGDSARDLTEFTHISNTFALELNEGFNKWAKAGMRLFAAHDYQHFSLPSLSAGSTGYNKNYITLGAQISKRQGSRLHFDVIGELRADGKRWGEFKVAGNGSLNIPVKRDTLRLMLRAHIYNRQPLFYFTHSHMRNAWWDNNNFSNTFSTRIGGTLSWGGLSVDADVETIQNYIYLKETLTPQTSSSSGSTQRYLHSVSARQTSKNLQILCGSIRYHLKSGIFNWENQLTGQISSESDIIPLPALGAYSNIYLDFRIAKVLHTEVGADAYYFTSYYAPTYSPIAGAYAVQDNNYHTKIGNYPVVDAYLNFHLKHTRFYIMASHLNYSKGSGKPFLTPHNPLNGMVLRLGLSWNFFN